MSERGRCLPDNGLKAGTKPSLGTSRQAILLAAGVIALATLATYSNCFSVPFLFDDRPSIVENPTLRHLWPIGPVLRPPAGGLTVSGRPLVNLSLAVNYALGGLRPVGYHAVNLAVHLLASLTLFGIVRRTLVLQPALRQRFGATALPLATAIALLWAVHPLQTEAVTYLVQRAESLMGLFYLLTLYGFIRGTESGKKGWYVLAVAACLLGMTTKEVMVSAPLLVLCYDRTFVAGTFSGALRQRRGLYAGLASGWLPLAYLVVGTGELGSQRAGFHTEVTWWPYALTQSWAILHYLWLSVWPHPLVFDYGTLLVSRGSRVIPSALMVILLVAVAAASLWRRTALGFLGCWFFLILAPTSSVMPLAGQTVVEHRMYLPLAAVVTLIVLGTYAWVGRRSLIVFLILALVLGLLSVQRNADYRSELVIWRDTVAKRADNARAQNNLGLALLDAGQVGEAVTHFQRALEIRPNLAEPHNSLGNALLRIGRVDEAILQFQKAAALLPDSALVFNNLGFAFLQKGEVDEAISCFQKALGIQPDDAGAHDNLATAFLQEGQLDEAIRHYYRALEIRPDSAETCHNLGLALFRKGRADEAITCLLKAVQIEPNFAQAHGDLGNVLLQNGRLREAIGHYQKCLELRPDDPGTLGRLSWLLSASPDASIRNGARAVELARQAIRLTDSRSPVMLGTLAAAYAEAGQMPEAMANARQALQLAADQGNSALSDALRVQIQSYQAGFPFRDASLTNAPVSSGR